MKIFNTKLELKKEIQNLKKSAKTIGFVPTMGALHKGHLSLMQKAKENCDILVVSIFVNPTQFDNPEDLKKYPKTLDKDINMLNSIDCNYLYTPTIEDIYDDNVKSSHFDFDGLENQMEGKFRTGHFDGVGTIVKKLFEVVTPDMSFFGEKDFQQLQIIKKIVEKHNIPTKIIGCPIFREEDGLAMSSRNTRLSKKHRLEAPFIYKTLKEAKSKLPTNSINEIIQWVNIEFENNPLLELEYFTIADEKTLKPTTDKLKKLRGFIAVYAGEIRLIDTIKFY